MTATSLYPVLDCAGLCSGRTAHACVGTKPGTPLQLFQCTVCKREQTRDRSEVPPAADVTPLVGARASGHDVRRPCVHDFTETVDEDGNAVHDCVGCKIRFSLGERLPRPREPNIAVTLVRELEAATEQRSGVVARVNGADLHAEAAELRAEVDRLAGELVERERRIVRTNAMQREQDAASLRRSAEWGSTFEARRDEIGRLTGELAERDSYHAAEVASLLRTQRNITANVDKLLVMRTRSGELCEAVDAFARDGSLANWCRVGDARNALRPAVPAPQVERDKDALPPGWVRSDMHGNIIDWEADPVNVYVVGTRTFWAMRDEEQVVTGTPRNEVPMHEAMRLARGLATVDELWTQPAPPADSVPVASAHQEPGGAE